jgi:hypothetical protein
MAAHLYLSLWHLCLDHLSQGRFERGVISADDARTMIRDARTDTTVGFHLITALPPQEATAFVTPAGLAARPAGGLICGPTYTKLTGRY